MIRAAYAQHGFVVLPKFAKPRQLQLLRDACSAHHRHWCARNFEFYRTRAVNSAYLTADQSLSDAQRMSLLSWVSSKAMAAVLQQLMPNAGFMNTQLFFNPYNRRQKNYWHRDPQYHMTLAEQRAALAGPQVIHCRLALYDEPGIEVIPGSHKRWDTGEQLNVRLGRSGREPSDDLPQGQRVPLKAGDLLVFSALMLHRGCYGGQRMALDALYGENISLLLGNVPQQCLPTVEEYPQFDCPEIFQRTQDWVNHSAMAK